MARPRPTIFALMLLVLFSAIWLAASRGESFREVVAVLVVAWLALFLVQYARIIARASIGTHRNRRLLREPDLTTVDLSAPGLPDEVSKSFLAAGRDLAPLGFTLCRSLSQAPFGGMPGGHVSIFRDEATGEVARLTQVIVGSGAARKVSINVVFATEFVDGCKVLTTDNAFPGIFPPLPPPVHTYKFPEVDDLAQLLGYHRALARRFESGRVRRDPIGSDPVAYQREEVRRVHDHFVACGYYQIDEDARVIRPSWKGAILGSLKVAWPGRAIQLALRRRRAARLIRDLERQA